MCFDPGSLSTISTLVGLASSGVSAVGQIQQGNAAAAAAKFKSKQERMQAEDALKRGAQEEEAQRRKTAALLGRQKAVMAASNVDLGSGSPLAILGDTAMLGELDAQRIKDNADREAAFYNTQATLTEAEGDAAKSAGMMAGFGTVLGGVGTLASKWYQPAYGQAPTPTATTRIRSDLRMARV